MTVKQQNEKPTANGLAETLNDGVFRGQPHPKTLPDETVEFLLKRVMMREVIAFSADLIVIIH